MFSRCHAAETGSVWANETETGAVEYRGEGLAQLNMWLHIQAPDSEPQPITLDFADQSDPEIHAAVSASQIAETALMRAA